MSLPASRMLKKPAIEKPYPVKRISQDMKLSACERRDTRDERQTKRTAFLSILRDFILPSWKWKKLNSHRATTVFQQAPSLRPSSLPSLR